MGAVPQFRDGTLFTSENFSIRDRFRPITYGERHGITLAASECAGTPGYSIILVKVESIVARAISYETVSAACVDLEAQLPKRSRRRIWFAKRLVAVLNFAPDKRDAINIAATGADALFVPHDLDTAFIGFWLGTPRDQFREGDKNGMQERALVTPHYRRI